MGSSNSLMTLQAFLTSLQMINAGLATVHPNAWVVLIVGAAVGGLQLYVQLAGNRQVPPPPPAQPPATPGGK